MKSVPRGRRVFISKHSARMCGVWKFMKRWRQWKEDQCPRCGEPEDAAHVWKCNGEGAKDIWEKALDELEMWLRSVDTDLTLTYILVTSLKGWQSGVTGGYKPPRVFQEAISN
jgi:hypothetical protein